MSSNGSEINTKRSNTDNTILFVTTASLIGIIFLIIDTLVDRDFETLNNRCEQLNSAKISSEAYCSLPQPYKDIIAICGITGPSEGQGCPNSVK